MDSGSYVYVSPHLDDAVFSCGGLIHAQRQAGKRVAVLTLCAASSAGPLSPLARKYHDAWAESGDPLSRRRSENAAVLAAWGVESQDGGAPDAIYRGASGTAFYSVRDELFREPDPRDAARELPAWEAEVRRLADGPGDPLLLVPLGVGRHVDHELARRLGERLAGEGRPVWFYEDYPYAEVDPGGVRQAQERFSPGPSGWSSRTVPIDVDAKIEAVRGYRSQIGNVFGREKDLARRVRAFTARTARAGDREEPPTGPVLRPRRPLRTIWRAATGRRVHAERFWSLG